MRLQASASPALESTSHRYPPRKSRCPLRNALQQPLSIEFQDYVSSDVSDWLQGNTSYQQSQKRKQAIRSS
eukprot:767397-Hanusia_phi.AAC.2